MSTNSCRCGSGRRPRPLYDAAGIYLAPVCSTCEPIVRRHYRPEVFSDRGEYARTGDEWALLADAHGEA